MHAWKGRSNERTFSQLNPMRWTIKWLCGGAFKISAYSYPGPRGTVILLQGEFYDVFFAFSRMRKYRRAPL